MKQGHILGLVAVAAVLGAGSFFGRSKTSSKIAVHNREAERQKVLAADAKRERKAAKRLRDRL